MKNTMNLTLEEIAKAMGVTPESLAKLPLSKVTEIFDNYREGRARMYKFDTDIITNNLERTKAKGE
jgi:transcriptional regulator with XRE-family HTH domain